MAEGHVRLTVCDNEYRYLSWLSKINNWTVTLEAEGKINNSETELLRCSIPSKTHETIFITNQGKTTQPLQEIY
jgi:hypothetical protein